MTADGSGSSPQAMLLIAQVRNVRRRGYILVAAVGLFVNILQLSVPFYMLQVYDRVIGTGNVDTLVALTVLLAGCLIVFGLLDFIESQLLVAIGHSVADMLALPAMEEAVARVGGTGGSRASQAYRDVAEIRSFYSGSAGTVPFSVVLSPVMLGVLFFLHPAYALIAALGALVLLGFSLARRKGTVRASARASEEVTRISAELDAAGRASEAILAMGIMPSLARRWRAAQRQQLALSYEIDRRSKRKEAAAKVVRLGLQGLVLGVGALLILNRAASPGSIFAASLITARVLAPFERLVESRKAWAMLSEAFSRLENLLLQPHHRENGQLRAAPRGQLSIDRVTYVPPGGRRPTVSQVSLEVGPGEALGIVGPSAAGKTTLARLAVGALGPAGGGVFLDGQNVWHWNKEHLGQHIGYLPQAVCLLAGTVAENIARMGPIDHEEVLEAARRASAHEMIGRLPDGYGTEVGEAGTLLSGGQRQLIAIARALYRQPSLLVLDEPNAHLDSLAEQNLLEAVRHAKDWGAAVLIVAHRPSVLVAVDRIAVMREGRIERIGTREEIFKGVTVHPGALRRDAEASAGERLPRSRAGDQR